MYKNYDPPRRLNTQMVIDNPLYVDMHDFELEEFPELPASSTSDIDEWGQIVLPMVDLN